MAELADALASGASVLIGRAGSSPAPGTVVKSRDIVPISVSRDFLRFGGSFSRDMRQKVCLGLLPRVGVGLSSKNVSDRRVANSLDLAFPDTD